MPTAPLRPCAYPGCPVRVTRGHCPTHRRTLDLYRGSASSRGYDSHWSKVFRPQYFAQLVALGIPPVCGARLPDGPASTHSRCQADGLLNGDTLHLDHEPPLTDAERKDRHAVCDRRRIVLLCSSCHSLKTATEHGGVG